MERKKSERSKKFNTTIVGGRPPEAGFGTAPIPLGIEILVKKASIDPVFQTRLLEHREKAAGDIGLQLDDAEIVLLQTIPSAHLKLIIKNTVIKEYLKPAFLGKVASVMIAALGLFPISNEAVEKADLIKSDSETVKIQLNKNSAKNSSEKERAYIENIKRKAKHSSDLRKKLRGLLKSSDGGPETNDVPLKIYEAMKDTLNRRYNGMIIQEPEDIYKGYAPGELKQMYEKLKHEFDWVLDELTKEGVWPLPAATRGNQPDRPSPKRPRYVELLRTRSTMLRHEIRTLAKYYKSIKGK